MSLPTTIEGVHKALQTVTLDSQEYWELIAHLETLKQKKDSPMFTEKDYGTLYF